MIEPYRFVGNGASAYPVYIGAGLLDELNVLTKEVAGNKRRMLVSSAAIARLLGERLSPLIAEAGQPILFGDGETNKTATTVLGIIELFLDRGLKRDSIAILVGGGVVGDAAGFAAAIFLRGIDVIQVPTTLLAQVDSSIGGKVGVNVSRGKNLIGAFHQPRAVISDVTVLGTLPGAELVSGLFESLKSGVIGDVALFDLFRKATLEELREEALLLEIVRRSVDLKANIVSSDVREGGARRLLNYGHTIGHGVEAALDYAGLTHGEAVGWGMLAANAIAVRRGLLSQVDSEVIEKAVFGLSPRKPRSLDRAKIESALAHDKKFSSTKRVMVLPRRIGECEIVEDVTTGEITFGIDAMTERMAV
ncbi:MAG TPA: 3-dehydroquinate synthase [Thermoanaerobaculia bacterium]|nr:3-dehydroquinate synthase [Thermoanaerobaculia bacterium]